MFSYFTSIVRVSEVKRKRLFSGCTPEADKAELTEREPHALITHLFIPIASRHRHYVTMHGLALNVNTDLRYFSYIHPCGFIDKGSKQLPAQPFFHLRHIDATAKFLLKRGHTLINETTRMDVAEIT